ncbi:M16 family metallopeptidase, partial [candidate division KSB1 bacterium]
MHKENSVFHKTVLDSGITIVSEQLPYVRSVSLGFWARTGSRNENEKNNGISHFLEHMVFKGTPKRKSFEIAESLESLGGTINAYTGKETTCFFAHVLDEHLPLAIDVLSDIVQDPLLKEKDIEKEKLVIAEEINSINDNAEEMIYDYFHSTIFKGNSLESPILGNIDNVKSFSRNDLLNYWERNYRANNFVIAACGNLKHEELIKLVENYFRLPGSDNEIKYDKPVDISNRYLNATKKIFQSHSCLGFRSISYTDDRKFPLLVLNTFFGNGMSSRLFQNIREKCGFTYSVYSFTDFYSDIGDFGVYMAYDKNKREEALNRVKEEFL